jgi:hypothetical protein
MYRESDTEANHMYVGGRFVRVSTEPEHVNAIFMLSRILYMTFYPFSHHKHEDHHYKSN